MPRASPSGSRARESRCSRERRLEHRTALAEPRPPRGAACPRRRAAARAAPLLRASHGIGHRRRGRRAGHARPGFRRVAGPMRQEAVKTAVSRFVELPTLQRSVVILKDVLDESLIEIAALLDLTVDAVKGHLARGRARLREINAQAGLLADARPASAAVARYVALFNQRDWDGLRALLADDVKLKQSTYPLRVGKADVGMFFGIYAKLDPVWLVPAWLEGREVIAVFEDRADPKPSYMMWLEWRDGLIGFIRDYRYVGYVAADAELTLAPDAMPAGGGTAH